MQRYFIITVDTEGDNLWDYHHGDEISIENGSFIARFQELANKFSFKPVYLTNYEMLSCLEFVKNAKRWLQLGQCEIGIHIHAWNNPPLYELSGPFNYNPYLIEYPYSIMKEKFRTTHNLIKQTFGITPKSHRAGRWAMDKNYFKLLKEFEIEIDCSVTPNVDWSRNVGITRGGANYSQFPKHSYWEDGVLEVPMTIRKIRHVSEGRILHRIKSGIKGEIVWLRPATHSLALMKRLVDIVLSEDNVDYIEFMIHSSELMPGGSPYFRSEDDIDRLYSNMEQIFEYIKNKNFTGVTLTEYRNLHSKNGNFRDIES